MFEHLGDRVKSWITVNEPNIFCFDYGVSSSGVGCYLCAHHVLLAHAAVYRLYKAKYFVKQKGKVGISLNAGFAYPGKGVDQKVPERHMEFVLGMFANPIFTNEGGYPKVLIETVDQSIKKEGRLSSRLPKFTEQQIRDIQGTSDFFGLNYYSSKLTDVLEDDEDDENNDDEPKEKLAWVNDMNILSYPSPEWKQAKSYWLHSVPEGLRDLLTRIKNKYNSPEVIITENGWSDEGQLEDDDRIHYIKAHLAVISQAITDGCNVTAYTVITQNYLNFKNKTMIFFVNFRFGAFLITWNGNKALQKDLESTTSTSIAPRRKGFQRSQQSFSKK